MDENNENKEVLLTQITELVGKDIVKYLNLKSRLRFRQTSYLHRELVDNGDFCINRLVMGVNEDYNKITSTDGFKKKFEQLNRGSNWPWKNWENAMKLILGSNEKQVIKQLDVMMYIMDQEDDMISIALRSIRNEIFSKLPHPPKVESLYMQFSEFFHLSKVLPYLDSTVIKHITIDFIDIGYADWEETERSDDLLEDFEAVHQLEQWKSARSFRSFGLPARGEHLLYFSHFNFAKFRIMNAPSVERIMEFKEKLLLNPNLNQIYITIEMETEAFQTINNLIETYNFADNPNPAWATFQYPNSNKTLSMCVMGEWIWFKGPCFEKDSEREHDWDGDEEDDDDSESEGEDDDDSESEREDGDDSESVEEDGYDDEDLSGWEDEEDGGAEEDNDEENGDEEQIEGEQEVKVVENDDGQTGDQE